MRKIAVPIARLAQLCMRNEWFDLRSRLLREYEAYKQNVYPVSSVLMQQLLISGEDHRFFGHGGIDLVAVCRALWRWPGGCVSSL